MKASNLPKHPSGDPPLSTRSARGWTGGPCRAGHDIPSGVASGTLFARPGLPPPPRSPGRCEGGLGPGSPPPTGKRQAPTPGQAPGARQSGQRWLCPSFHFPTEWELKSASSSGNGQAPLGVSAEHKPSLQSLRRSVSAPAPWGLASPPHPRPPPAPAVQLRLTRPHAHLLPGPLAVANRQGGLWVQNQVTKSYFKKSYSFFLIRKVIHIH